MSGLTGRNWSHPYNLSRTPKQLFDWEPASRGETIIKLGSCLDSTGLAVETWLSRSGIRLLWCARKILRVWSVLCPESTSIFGYRSFGCESSGECWFETSEEKNGGSRSWTGHSWAEALEQGTVCESKMAGSLTLFNSKDFLNRLPCNIKKHEWNPVGEPAQRQIHALGITFPSEMSHSLKTLLNEILCGFIEIFQSWFVEMGFQRKSGQNSSFSQIC
jgi:hypothetical protein